MNWLRFVFSGILARKGSWILSTLAITFSILLVLLLFGFYAGYTTAMDSELNTLGVQIMAVPKGCPYASTTMLLHGGHIDGELPSDTLENISELQGVISAEGVVMGQVEISSDSKWVLFGTTPGYHTLKTGWNINGNYPENPESVMIGSQVAETLSLNIGDSFLMDSISVTVSGILSPTGTSDDSFIFSHIDTAREILNLTGFTAVMADVESGFLADVSVEIEELTDAQPVTVNQVATTIQGLVDSARSILLAVILVAILASSAVVAGSSLLGIIEQSKLIGVQRSIGATPWQVSFGVLLQVLIVTVTGGILGVISMILLRLPLENLLRILIPDAPLSSLVVISPNMVFITLGISVVLGLLSAVPSLFLTFRSSPMTRAGGT